MRDPLLPSQDALTRWFGPSKLQFVNTDDPPLLGCFILPGSHHIRVLARYKGSRTAPYRVEACIELTQWRVRCDCPDGADGRCKHAATLLCTWRARPELFSRQETSSDDALLTFIFNAFPQARLALELPVPGTTSPDSPATRFKNYLGAISREAAVLEWSPSQHLRHLDHTLALMDAYVNASQVPTGVALLEALIDHVFEHMSTWRPSRAPVAELLNRVIAHIDDLLKLTDLTSSLRRQLWAALIQLVAQHTLPECAAAAQASILLSCRTQDTEELILMIRQAMPDRDHELLFRLDSDPSTGDAYITRCLALGLSHEVALYFIDRHDEQGLREHAQAQTRDTQHILMLAATLAAHDVGHWIADIIESQLQHAPIETWSRWLETHHATHQQWTSALTVAQARFLRQPDQETMIALRGYAIKAQQWTTARPNLVQWLSAQQQHGLLLELHRLDEQWGAWWSTYARGQDEGLHLRLSWLTRCARAVPSLMTCFPERTLVMCLDTLRAVEHHHPAQGAPLRIELNQYAKRLQASLGAS